MNNMHSLSPGERKMDCPHLSSLRVALCTLQFALCMLLLIASPARSDKEDITDPFPLRRVLLPAEKLPAELKRLDEGVLAHMPRSEFEDLVRQAARGRGRKQPPRLLEARYRATLGDSAPTGSAQWKVLHSGEGSALLRLQSEGQPFNLAVKQPRYKNRDALIAEFPDASAPGGRSLALLVDQPGEHTVLLEWSSRTEIRPEGYQVDLRIPACPAASMEINLPADHALSALDDTLVSGPFPAENPGRALWKVVCGGKANLPLLIRRGGRAEPLLLSRQKTLQKLSPDGLESLTSFQIEALHQEVRELICECDPILRPIEVVAPYLEGWEVRGNQVVIRLERPLREGTVEVRCLAPLGDRAGGKGAIAWTSPNVRLDRAVPRGETLELWLHPELRVTSWHPGDFRLTDSAPIVDPEKRVRLRRLLLLGGGLGPASDGKGKNTVGLPRRPSATLQTGAIGLRVRQQTWWRLGVDRMSVTAKLDCEVRQGLLFQLPLRLPAGWDVDTVEMEPADLLRNSGVRTDKGVSTLLVDLRRPLRPAGTIPSGPPGMATLTVRLRPSAPGSFIGQDLPFPEVVPVGADYREGGLAIDYDEQVHRAAVQTTAVSSEPTNSGPWGRAVPDFYYPFKGEAIAGTLRLAPRAPRFSARVMADVFVAGGRAVMQTRLVLEGEGGMPSQVEVFLADGPMGLRGPLSLMGPSSSVGPDPSPAGNRLLREERLYHREAAAGLAGLGAISPLHAAVLQAARPRGSFWRLTLQRPLAVRQPLTLRGTSLLTPIRERDAAGPAWDVPLPVVLAASRQDGEVTLHIEGPDAVLIESKGLREVPAAAQSPHGIARRFRFAGLPAWLTVQTRVPQQAAGVARASEAFVDGARLTTVLTAEGELRHHFLFRLLRWSQRTLPVQLPDGARLLAAGVNGNWLERFSGSDATVLDLPVLTPSSDEEITTTFEILYNTRPTSSGAFSRLTATAPVLPVAPASFARRWLLPPGVLPLSDGGSAPAARQRLV